MRRFVIIITLLFALFAFINAATQEDKPDLMVDGEKAEFVK
jgi:hypothetical protein